MDESVAIGAAAVRPDGDDAPSGMCPIEYDLCSEQCRLNHSTTVPGRFYNMYYSVHIALSNRESWKDERGCQGARGSFLGFIRGKTNPASICMRVSAGVTKIKLCGERDRHPHYRWENHAWTMHWHQYFMAQTGYHTG